MQLMIVAIEVPDAVAIDEALCAAKYMADEFLAGGAENGAVHLLGVKRLADDPEALDQRAEDESLYLAGETAALARR